jgi:dihydroxyacetone kinase
VLIKENNMQQIIEINVDNKIYNIEWALSEYFDELKGMKFMLNKVAADQIVMIDNLSETAKILLSAVAGAVIQHLIDNNCQIESIFNGYFIIK